MEIKICTKDNTPNQSFCIATSKNNIKETVICAIVNDIRYMMEYPVSSRYLNISGALSRLDKMSVEYYTYNI